MTEASAGKIRLLAKQAQTQLALAMTEKDRFDRMEAVENAIKAVRSLYEAIGGNVNGFAVPRSVKEAAAAPGK